MEPLAPDRIKSSPQLPKIAAKSFFPDPLSFFISEQGKANDNARQDHGDPPKSLQRAAA